MLTLIPLIAQLCFILHSDGGHCEMRIQLTPKTLYLPVVEL